MRKSQHIIAVVAWAAVAFAAQAVETGRSSAPIKSIVAEPVPPAESLPNRVIGLDIVLVDDAKDGVPKSMVVWQGTKDNATDPSQFGSVVLDGENNNQTR